MEATSQRGDEREEVPVVEAATDGRTGRDVPHDENSRIRYVRKSHRY